MNSSTKISVLKSIAFTGQKFTGICIIEAKFMTGKKKKNPAGVGKAATKTSAHSEHTYPPASFLKIPYPRECALLLPQSVKWGGLKTKVNFAYSFTNTSLLMQTSQSHKEVTEKLLFWIDICWLRGKYWQEFL